MASDAAVAAVATHSRFCRIHCVIAAVRDGDDDDDDDGDGDGDDDDPIAAAATFTPRDWLLE